MENIVQNLTSPTWWVGVVIVGLIISVVGAYLKSIIDTLLIKASKKWRNRKMRLDKERTDLVKELYENPHQQILLGFDEMRCRFRSSVYLVTAIVLIAAAASTTEIKLIALFGFIGNINLLLGSLEHLGAMKKKSLLKDASEYK